MLALSRSLGERIVLPSLNISIEVLQIKGRHVRIGISAPQDVGIFREEIAPPPDQLAERLRVSTEGLSLTHAQRNQLNTAVLAFHVAAKQLQQGMVDSAEKTLLAGVRILEELDKSAEHAVAAAGTGQRLIKALLVEDDPVEESLLTSFLRLSGFRVEIAHDGYEALDYLASHTPPDFVLLDMRMPRLTGSATVAAIRSNPQLSRLRIFAVTGTTEEEAGIRTGPGGVDGWFQKPINPAKLAQAMSASFAN